MQLQQASPTLPSLKNAAILPMQLYAQEWIYCPYTGSRLSTLPGFFIAYICMCVYILPKNFFFVEAAQCPLVPALVTDYKKYFLDFPKCRAHWNLLVA